MGWRESFPDAEVRGTHRLWHLEAWGQEDPREPRAVSVDADGA